MKYANNRIPADDNAIISPPQEKRVTFSDYRASRKGFIFICVLLIGFGLVLSVIPGIIIYAAIYAYDSTNEISGPFTVIFAGIGIIVFIMIFKTVFQSLGESFRELKNNKECFLRQETKEERIVRNRNNRKKCIVLVALLCLSIAIGIGIHFQKEKKTVSIYTAAEQYILNDDYRNALSELKKIEEENYKDIAALIVLCDAGIDYQRNDIPGAVYTLGKAEFHFLSRALDQKIQSLRTQLNKDHAEYLKKQAERKASERNKTSTTPSKTVLPHIGMSESALYGTSLGYPSEVKKCNDFDSLRINVRYKTFIWRENGERIFEATVGYQEHPSNGGAAGWYVYSIWEDANYAIKHNHGSLDTAPAVGTTVTSSQISRWQGGERDNITCNTPTRKYRYDVGNYCYIIWVNDNNVVVKVSTTIFGYNSKTKKPDKNKTYEYPDRDDYLDAEDLYDWYYDDFYDYEEAEEYLDGWD